MIKVLRNIWHSIFQKKSIENKTEKTIEERNQIDESQIINNKIEFLLNRIRSSNPDRKRQESNREKAYLELAEMSDHAESIIPSLIEKLLYKDAKERELARKVLNQIDKDWSNSKAALKSIPFLIKNLGQKPPNSAIAIKTLKQIGAPAITRIIESLDKKEIEDSATIINALKLLKGFDDFQEDERLFQIVKRYLLEGSHNALMVQSLEILSINKKYDKKIIKRIAELLIEETSDLKLASLNFVNELKSKDKILFPSLLQCIVDNNEDVRLNAIDILSYIEDEILSDFYINTLKTKGEIAEEEIKSFEERFRLIFSSGDLQPYGYIEDYINNVIWHFHEILKDTAKPGLRLISVIQVLANKNALDSKWYNHLVPLLKDSHESIQIIAIEALSKIKGQQEKVIEKVLPLLDSNNLSLQDAVLQCLDKQNDKWYEQEGARQLLKDTINSYRPSEEDRFKNLFERMGKKSIPILMESLLESTDWTVDHFILRTLDKIDLEEKEIKRLKYKLDKTDNQITNKMIISIIAKTEKKY